LPREQLGVFENEGEGRMVLLCHRIEVFQWDTICAAKCITPDWVEC
jgi:hypothetical protein